jgi:hypothetical protein
MALAERFWPNVANLNPLVLRVMVVSYTVRNVR